MKVGFFFELEERSLSGDQPFVFRYRRIFANNRRKFCPIYAKIKANSLSFYYNGYKTNAHIELFQLSFSDNNLIGRTIEEELNLLPSNQFSINSTSFPDALALYSPSRYTYRLDGHIFPPDHHPETLLSKPPFYQPFSQKKPKEKNFTLETLLLHFLFDLQHSDLFQHSPHYDRFRTVIRENTLWSAILSKAEYVYQRELRLQETEAGVPSTITRDYYREAEAKWLQLLIGEESGPVISGSPWFADNLEEEVNEVLWPGLNTPASREFWPRVKQRVKARINWLAGKEMAIEPVLAKESSSLVQNITNWYLNRYNYYRAYRLTIEYHPFHRYYIHASWLIWLLAIVFLAMTDSHIGVINKIVIGYCFFVCFTTGIFIFSNDQEKLAKKERKKKIHLLTVVNFLSPRLIITLVLGWFIYKEFSDLEHIPAARVCAYYFISILVIPLYLFREVKSISYDLDNFDTVIRVILVSVRTFVLTLLTGILIIGALTPEICGDRANWIYHIGAFTFAPKIVLQHAGFVFFTGLFVNLLFKDKRVTGF